MLDFDEIILKLYFDINNVDIKEKETIDTIDLRGRTKLISCLINDRFYILILNDYDIALSIIYKHEVYHNFIDEIRNNFDNIDFYDVRQSFYDYKGVYNQSITDVKKVITRFYYKHELNI